MVVLFANRDDAAGSWPGDWSTCVVSLPSSWACRAGVFQSPRRLPGRSPRRWM
jgi:hypothetical protein